MDVRRRDELLVALGGVLLLVALFALPWWEASADGVEITGTLDGWKACYRSRCATGDLSLFPSVTHWFSVLLGLGSVAVGGAGLLGVRLHDSIAAWLSRFALICVAMLAWKLLRTPTFGFVVVFVELHRGPGLVVGLAGAALAATRKKRPRGSRRVLQRRSRRRHHPLAVRRPRSRPGGSRASAGLRARRGPPAPPPRRPWGAPAGRRRRRSAGPARSNTSRRSRSTSAPTTPAPAPATGRTIRSRHRPSGGAEPGG
jgi:hypothetical protein